MKNVFILPRVYKDESKQLRYSIEKNWIKFFDKKKINIIPFISNNRKIENIFKICKPHALVISGGNDIFSKSYEDVYRYKNNIKILKYFLKKKKPILAVCYGFQMITRMKGGKIFKSKHKIAKDHVIYLKKKKIYVNSFHNYSVFKIPKNFKSLANHKDKSIEIAFNDKLRILCTMFHPERKNKSQRFIKNLIYSHLKLWDSFF